MTAATTPLSVEDFPRFFTELWSAGTKDVEPFPWQVDLVQQLQRDRRWPELVDLPTGSGKSSLLEIAIFLMALGADLDPRERWMPRRVVLVVDRRVIVDQAADRGRGIVAALAALADPRRPICQRVARRLSTLSAGGPPLTAQVMRGGIERDSSWASRPDVPTLLASTVDQVGSRLLFRGYGVTDGMRPVHAGLLGADCLFLLDEVHLARPFAETLKQVEHYRAWREIELPSRWEVVELTATPTVGAERIFPATPIEPGSHPVLRRRLEAVKPARLEPVSVVKDADRADAQFGAACTRLARELIDQRQLRTIGVIVNRVGTARRVAEELARNPGDLDVVLLTGRMRPLERDAVLGRWRHRLELGRTRNDEDKPLVLVATQSIEAGADFDLDGIVTECASLDALRQRFGRVDRDGALAERGTPSYSVIAIRSTQVGGTDPDPIYGGALRATWAWLSGLDQVDFGLTRLPDPEPVRLRALLPPARNAPILLPTHLEQLARTSHPVTAEPLVERWLHGIDQDAEVADVQLVWRADIDPSLLDAAAGSPEDLAFWLTARVGACPPLTGEMLSVPVAQARAWLAQLPVEDVADTTVNLGTETTSRDGRLAIRWRRGAAELVAPAAIAPGDVLVLPAAYGGLWHGNWAPEQPALVKSGADLAALATLSQRNRAIWRFVRASHGVGAAGVDRAGEDLLPEALADLPMRDRRQRVADALALARASSTKAWEETVLDHLVARLASLRLISAPECIDGEVQSSYLVLSTRPVRDASLTGADEASDLGAEDQEATSFTGVDGARLDEHLAGVGSWALRFATALGLDQDRCRDLEVAGHLHDLGKADPRFQAWLRGGEPPPPGAELLAKSTVPDLDRSARARHRELAGYPRGGRHELTSVALVEGTSLLDAARDPDLVLHLVGTHHGFGRYRFDPVEDPEPVTVRAAAGGAVLEVRSDHGAERVDAPGVERFWRLQRRYGWYGLAWLEAVLRLADQERSRQEQRAMEAAR